MKKWFFHNVKEYIENNSNCKLNSTEYVNMTANLSLKCKCGDNFEVSFHNFKSSNKRQCNKCSLIKSHEKFVQEIYDLYGDKFTILGNYIRNDIKIRVKNNETMCEYDIKPNNLLQYAKRGYLGKIVNKSTENFIQILKNLYGNEFDVLGEFTETRKVILVRHNICGNEYEILANTLLKTNACKFCANNQVKSHEYFCKEIKLLVNDDFDIIDNYINSYTKIKFKSNICGHIFEDTPHNFLHRPKCKICSKSSGEQKIYRYLINNNINFEDEYIFSDCKNIRSLPFDFAIFDNNYNLKLIIEYDGEQHFRDNTSFGNKLEEIKIKDNIKTQYCQDNHIKLVRIPYWNFDNIEEILADLLLK